MTPEQAPYHLAPRLRVASPRDRRSCSSAALQAAVSVIALSGGFDAGYVTQLHTAGVGYHHIPRWRTLQVVDLARGPFVAEEMVRVASARDLPFLPYRMMLLVAVVDAMRVEVVGLVGAAASAESDDVGAPGAEWSAASRPPSHRSLHPVPLA